MAAGRWRSSTSTRHGRATRSKISRTWPGPGASPPGRRPLPGGLVVVLAGVAWLTLLDGDSTYAAGVLPQIVLIGTGVGVAIVPFNTVILATAPAEHAGVTAGVLQTALTIGGSVGPALLLIPFAGAGQGAADTITSVFVWASLITVAAILVPLVLWFGPGAAKGKAPAA
ncbi:MFS transporter [Streptomyces sp. NPDC056844]|uniref:MFS transporter n=1 Tax=unclassified Streptomyces TaxID=2593676 RepID=UPI0036C59EF3